MTLRAITIAIALTGSALFYMLVYLPLVLSFGFRTPNHRALRIALRVAPVFAVAALALRTQPPRPDFGDDVAGNIHGAEYYFANVFWPDFTWTWATGLSCLLVALGFGVLACRWHRPSYGQGEAI